MRILFSSTAGAGHFGPLVPFIRSCLKHGHDTMVAAPAAMEAAATATGAAFRAFGDPPPEEMDEVMGSLGQLPREEANRVVVGEIFGRLDATAAQPRLREVIEEWRPELVVRESAEFGAAVAAELHDVPQVRVAIGLGAMERYMLGVVQPNLDELRRSSGLSGPNRHAETPIYTLFPAALEEDPLPASRFRDPGWVRSKGGDPFVYVTFGSVAGALPMVASVYGESMKRWRAWMPRCWSRSATAPSRVGWARRRRTSGSSAGWTRTKCWRAPPPSSATAEGGPRWERWPQASLWW